MCQTEEGVVAPDRDFTRLATIAEGKIDRTGRGRPVSEAVMFYEACQFASRLVTLLFGRIGDDVQAPIKTSAWEAIIKDHGDLALRREAFVEQYGSLTSCIVWVFCYQVSAEKKAPTCGILRWLATASDMTYHWTYATPLELGVFIAMMAQRRDSTEHPFFDLDEVALPE